MLFTSPGLRHVTLSLQIPAYQDLDWHGTQLLSTEFPELSMWTFTASFKGPQTISQVSLEGLIPSHW